jgi:hypothetical protein
MKSLQPVTSSAATLFRALPVPARVVTVIVGLLLTVYLWQIIVGLFVLSALGVGIYTMLKWLVR